RLEELAGHPLQRIGLSATQRPLDEVARFLGGFNADGPRPVKIVDAGHTKQLELRVEVPVDDMAKLGTEPLEIRSGPATRADARAGHHIHTPSKGVIMPKFRGALLACAALTERMHAGAVEQSRYPRNPIDVLAQQIVAMVAVEPWTVDDLERVVRRAAPFSDL